MGTGRASSGGALVRGQVAGGPIAEQRQQGRRPRFGLRSAAYAMSRRAVRMRARTPSMNSSKMRMSSAEADSASG